MNMEMIVYPSYFKLPVRWLHSFMQLELFGV